MVFTPYKVVFAETDHNLDFITGPVFDEVNVLLIKLELHPKTDITNKVFEFVSDSKIYPIMTWSLQPGLCCGNGILGITAARTFPNSKITFTDDSWMALESARINSERFGIKDVNFIWTNAYQDGPSGAHDLVLCNPPFHQGTRIGDEIAEEMFRNAHRSLTSGGRIRVVGNSHLGYGTSLARLFGNAEKLAQNSKFTIFESRRR